MASLTSHPDSHQLWLHFTRYRQSCHTWKKLRNFDGSHSLALRKRRLYDLSNNGGKRSGKRIGKILDGTHMWMSSLPESVVEKQPQTEPKYYVPLQSSRNRSTSRSNSPAPRVACFCNVDERMQITYHSIIPTSLVQKSGDFQRVRHGLHYHQSRLHRYE